MAELTQTTLDYPLYLPFSTPNDSHPNQPGPLAIATLSLTPGPASKSLSFNLLPIIPPTHTHLAHKAMLYP